MGSAQEPTPELAALAARTGVGAPGPDDGEHWRWWVYSSAAEDPATWTVLFRLVSQESDSHLAESVVLLMIERVDARSAMEWVDLLPTDFQGLPRARLRDVMVRDGVLAGRQVAVDDVSGWTRWLQREVAGSSESQEVLSVLETSGATRRIRGLARERMIALRRRARGH
ncbi:hypothetical protein [Cellulosimicrobium sp. E-16]|uniref:hypothetical protein n=1 Tax=Cellulosimicrobium sp. E-16 TaxID=3404049 RepID=UPI003CEBEB57